MKILLFCALATATAYSQAIPHMEKRGEATQLIVDGKPFLALFGELANTAPSGLMAGDNVQVTFSPDTPPGPEFVGLAEQEAGRFENGVWVHQRFLAGDDSTLRKDFANAAAMGQSGFGVRLFSQPHLWFAERAIQRVKVYRYK
jgi:hypothetical protein